MMDLDATKQIRFVNLATRGSVNTRREKKGSVRFDLNVQWGNTSIGAYITQCSIGSSSQFGHTNLH